LYRMQDNRQAPDLGPLCVTGATGGVGSLAVDIFSRAGYAVHAISGKADQHDYLRALGASAVHGRDALSTTRPMESARFGGQRVDVIRRRGCEVHTIIGQADQHDYLRALGAREVHGRDALSTTRPMESARFGGGLDNVGGPMLASLLAQTAPYGNVASAGLAASAELDATVMPFIIRGVSLLGVASAGTARDIREAVWQHLATDWKPEALDRICTREVGLEGLPEVFELML